MRMVDVIAKKRDGGTLAIKEIEDFVRAYTADQIPDYQASAFAMAIYFQGMDEQESAALTKAMAASGDQLDLSRIAGTKVDKHSTGGVGDKTTFILSPIVAAAGVPVAKLSGRGLGHTGGTIDKLEAFPGFETELEEDTFIELVNKNKIAIAGQSGNLTPADKKLYALRDVTATVNAMPLIASSIMSKKIAAGSDAIVLDVKVGSGAFMTDLPAAKELARTMVNIGNELDRRTVAVISDMDQPLGRMVGNTLEVKEVIDVLRGNGPEDIYRLSVRLAAHMLVLGGKAKDVETGQTLANKLIQDGSALDIFRKFLESQGADPTLVDHPERLAKANNIITVEASASGYISTIDATKIGQAAGMLGAGRMTKGDIIDHAVGVEVKAKVGDWVEKGDVLVDLHANRDDVSEVVSVVKDSYQISDHAPEERPLIFHEMI
ncbi:pyrimidine-nucleoside phosphorylase [Salicibibacter halophilus]|uniref:Pyrimidine-nucleoside phosphorylase n=1 Tax=Salicibibacter halophilus TaxID=2502791 RepID=A0A514LHB1_9BACI|nr:pyrimidine-nucleoside phosphorylase [Salicibibacter halophilus]QDI91246.1 pyrimidine-nucleoside phosphorylase [Salicibibacter halophilus]